MSLHVGLSYILLAISCAHAAKAAGADNSGISQFWTDDYKVFDKIYGRTSDRDLFGATLPSGISYGIDSSKLSQATEKKERFLDNDPSNSDLNDDQIDPFTFGNKFQYANQLKSLKQAKKPTKSFKFISTDFKPISQSTDPETYNYLKHLEKLQKDKIEFPEAGVGGFKPYLSYGGVNPEEADAYKSIQDILDAHEGNKAKKETYDQDEAKYITYPPKRGKGKEAKKPIRPYPSKSGVRCPSGRCRQRGTNTYRIRTVPYLRKIKKVITY